MKFISEKFIGHVWGFIVVLLFAFGGSCFTQDRQTEILWDNYGVPHIFAGSAEEMYYSFGWAQMHNHADLVLKLYGQARGKASEFWGDEYVESDKLISLFQVPWHAEQNYLKQKQPYRGYLDAFIRGINDYAAANPKAIGEKYRKVLPVSCSDVMAHVIRVLCLEFIAGDDIRATQQTVGKGSNAIAIAPSRSASGNAMLLTNPHLPWSDYFLWFEAHLQCDGFNAYGIALVGSPTITMAFNDHLGWAFTVNTMDGADRYELTLKDGGYLWNGKPREFKKERQVIRVLQPDGSLKDLALENRYSVHGPVTGEKGGKAYAIRMVGLWNQGIFAQFHRMAAATNLREFESAMKMMQNPMFNIIYGDREGNIMYLFNGNIPRRPMGDFGYWRGTIDGTTSKYLWKSILPYKDLPRVLNPSSGFIQNCNDTPWFCTWPKVLDPSDYPAYMAPQMMLLRPQRAMNMVLANTSITFDQLVDIKMNTGVEAAERFLDDLLAAIDQYPDTMAVKAAAVLRAWDRKTDSGSRGAILFIRWFDKISHTIFRVPWNPDQPSTTPDGFKDPKLIVDLLVKAAGEVQQKYGSLDVAWGTVYRFRMNDIDLPANGGSGEYGIFRTIAYMDDAGSKKRAVFGDSYIAVTEFSTPVKAMVSLSYGNATQPGTRHSGDQLGLMSEKKLRPALVTRKDILEHLEQRELINFNSHQASGR